MLQKRKTVDNCLLQAEEIGLVISCVTAMKENCGFAFWVGFDFAELLISKMKDYIFKLIFESGVDVSKVQWIKSRGKISIFIIEMITLIHM